MELITPAYTVNNFLLDAVQLSAVAFFGYVICYHATFQVLLWWHRRQRN
jgi:hypothetical protein